MITKDKIISIPGRLNAQALFYALVVSVIIALICGLFISVAYFFRLQQIDQFDNARLLRNVNSGVALVCSSKEELIEHKKLDLYGNEEDWIEINKSKWGLFSLGHVLAINKTTVSNDTLSKSFLIGGRDGAYSNIALYLTDRKKPLVLVGKTFIKGNAYLPEAGIKSGFIGGVGYKGTKLVRGKQFKSTPEFPFDVQKNIKALIELLNFEEQNTSLESQMKQSFEAETLVVSDQELYLDNVTLKGNILLKAKSEIYVSANSVLEDVILYAPKITIEDGFQGSIQAYATGELNVGFDCKLAYPSILGLFIVENSPEETAFNISEKTDIQGAVLVHQLKYRKKTTVLNIEKHVKISGQVIANAKVELKGSIYGSIVASRFLLNSSSSIYSNYLMDATIDRSKLPDYYLSPILQKKYRSQDIVKWMY